MTCHPHDRANPSVHEPSLGFGRFRVLLRQRRLLADGVPIALGTRAFELLLALVEANGGLVSKPQLYARIWPGMVVAEENLKCKSSLYARLSAKTTASSAPRLAAGIGLLPRFARPFLRADVNAYSYRGIGQIGGCFLNGPVGDRIWAGRSTRTFRKSRGSFVKLPRYSETAALIRDFLSP